MVQLDKGQLQVSIGDLPLHLVQAVLHFRHVPALAYGIFCRHRLFEGVSLLLVLANQPDQTLQIFPALRIPVQFLALVDQLDRVFDIGAVIFQVFRFVGLAE
ncbi:hypothetical protein D3C73_1469260 [compost metagenome]